MTDDTVAVVVPFSPTYTPERLLERAVDTIEAQTTPTEPVVVTDDEQQGPAWARNAGLERTDRRFVAFCDADDYWKERKIEKQMQKLAADESSLCLTQTVNKSSGEPNVEPFDTLAEFARDILLERSLSFTSAMLVDTAKAKPEFDERLTCREDHLFALQAAREGLSFVPEPLTIIQKHDGGFSQQGAPLEQKLASEQQFFEQAVDLFPDLAAYESRYWQQKYHGLGRKQYRRHNYDQSVAWLKTSLSYGFSTRTFGALVLAYLFRLLDG